MKKETKRNTSICLGCIVEFTKTNLTFVTIHSIHGMTFKSAFCEKCVKKENFPQNESFTIDGPVAKPRKPRAKNKVSKKTINKKGKK